MSAEIDTFSEDKQLFMITQFVMQWIMKIFRDTKFDYGINGYASPTQLWASHRQVLTKQLNFLCIVKVAIKKS